MKAAQPHQSEQPSRRAAAEPARVALAPVEVSFIDNRPEAIAQRRLADVIHHSPYMVAQRQQLHGLFGKAAQLQAGPEEDELFQGKFAAVQRLAGQEEEELLQGKFDPVQRAEAEQKREPRVNNTGLPDNLKTSIESLSGLSMDHVRVHYNSSQPAQLNALAYAQGSNIHVAPGQEQHLPHEAWHVVQQAQGRVQPTMQMKDGVPVNDDAGLEREADMMGSRATQLNVGMHDARTAAGDEPPRASNSAAPVAQLQLHKLTAKSLEAKIMESTLFGKYLTELKLLLQKYELIPANEYSVLAARALNDIYEALWDAFKKVEKEIKITFDGEDESRLQKLEDWISQSKAEVDQELSLVVKRLPKEAGEDQKALGKEATLRFKELFEAEEPTGPKIEGLHYAWYSGALPFYDAPCVEDVTQGLLGDCWLLGPLISLVNTPEGRDKISQMIEPNNAPADLYMVTLYEGLSGGGLEPIQIPVTAKFPMLDGKLAFAGHRGKSKDAPAKVALWPAIIEKAFAKLYGNSYSKLNGRVGGARVAFENVLGDNKNVLSDNQPRSGLRIEKDEVIKVFRETNNMVFGDAEHCYSVLAVDDKGCTLRNPHGSSQQYTWDNAEQEFKNYTSAPIKRPHFDSHEEPDKVELADDEEFSSSSREEEELKGEKILKDAWKLEKDF